MLEQADAPWSFDKERAALLVIDMQSDFVDEGAVMEVAMARLRVPVMRRVVELCRGADIPVIYTQHVLSDRFDISPLETAYQPRLKTTGMREGSAGAEIVAELAPLPGDVVIKKHRYDAFHNTQLETVLRNIRGAGRVDTVIIIGTVTSICCESTARSAFMRDYKVVFVGDANGGLDEASHRATLSIIGKVFGRVMTVDELARLF
ncbi:cysteine hydrolase [Mesorhizobium sp. CU2]|uniref:isochorismatase family protein n=1 Tax=unclassified Mesorhizobium TaxID=325217 RepID=UPI001127034D|nr:MULTISPECIES: isochorismatase family cysteine hydrolase [unclassified Mesorhizobium]TPN88524.1 cysteine hydrolase [Mesorhizobium sp. CU3]TPO21522.1 cysteine hydrolase [Mesorhizobium sp. CU2]